MKVSSLETANPSVRLVEPDVDRDAPTSLKWLEGAIGRNTLLLMGVSEKENTESSLDKEQERIKDFITKEDQLNWMIQLDDAIIGSIWVDLEPTEELPAPALHIMIGDPRARGQGVGLASTSAVIEYLKDQKVTQLYSRSLAKNSAASKLLDANGFQNLGDTYVDSDGLEWQNATLDLTR